MTRHTDKIRRGKRERPCEPEAACRAASRMLIRNRRVSHIERLTSRPRVRGGIGHRVRRARAHGTRHSAGQLTAFPGPSPVCRPTTDDRASRKRAEAQPTRDPMEPRGTRPATRPGLARRRAAPPRHRVESYSCFPKPSGLPLIHRHESAHISSSPFSVCHPSSCSA